MYWNWCLFHCLIFWDLFSYGLSAATTRDAGKGLWDNYGRTWSTTLAASLLQACCLAACCFSSYTNLVLVWLRTKMFGQEKQFIPIFMFQTPGLLVIACVSCVGFAIISWFKFVIGNAIHSLSMRTDGMQIIVPLIFEMTIHVTIVSLQHLIFETFYFNINILCVLYSLLCSFCTFKTVWFYGL